ncbi:MAG: nucleoside triphosphate pyrophosphatase [Chitinophagaceae bacterium]
MAKYVLASGSPRRKQLLEWAEIDFEIIVELTDETYPENLSNEDAVIHIAGNKIKAVLNKVKKNSIIIAADSVVVLNGEFIGKPKDQQHAFGILHKLSGQHHQVITGVVIQSTNKKVSFTDTTDVEFYHLTNEQIKFYVDKYKPYDKAGAYAIQEWIGVVGIKRIAGDFYNVMGLPISRVVQALKDF